MISLISLYLPTNFKFPFQKTSYQKICSEWNLLENIDLNVITLFFRYANLLGSVNVIIVDKEKDKTGEETEYTKYNYCKIRFLLCKFVQAGKLD